MHRPGGLPAGEVAFFSRNPVWCRTRAHGLGPHVSQLVDDLLAVQALHRLRSAQGILALADKHGPEALDVACATALAAGDPSYRTVRGILALPASPDGTRSQPSRNGSRAGAATSTPAHLHGPVDLLGHLPFGSDDTQDDDAQDDDTRDVAAGDPDAVTW